MQEGDAKSLLSSLSGEKWRQIGTKRRSGILAPLFHVYSKESVGIGDMGDLKLLIDWCRTLGSSIIQLLPMNEVGPLFCPYDSISSFAIEPAYIDLREIISAGGAKGLAPLAKMRKEFPSGRKHVDYRIKEAKLSLLRELFDAREGDLGTAEFKRFAKENAYWLTDFALFKVLKEKHCGKPWYEWEERFSGRDKDAIKEFGQEHKGVIAFHIWVQWHLYRQFASAKAYAATKKIYIKGDLPILVSRDSADVWSHPEFFKLECAAGAPPDMYCAKGQRWGMPTYNWEAKARDNYRYLKEKLAYAENFYHILRIDHVVGLFRIWSIPNNEPLENEGLNGFFDPQDEAMWEKSGKQILSVINKNTGMLLAAEDLGIIPKACPTTLLQFGMPGNDVQRWVKDWVKRHDFLDGNEYRFLSVSMLSTHDTTNWAAWWEDEAGTVDEALFVRKCVDRGIDFGYVKARLFDFGRSRFGRLRWLEEIGTVEELVAILGKRPEELKDFVEMYENTYKEKEKLWKHLGLSGAMREKADPNIVKAVLRFTYMSRSVFSIQLITDLLLAGNILKGAPHDWRINMPGTILPENWSLRAPLGLEELAKHKLTADIREMVKSSGRV